MRVFLRMRFEGGEGGLSSKFYSMLFLDVRGLLQFIWLTSVYTYLLEFFEVGP